VPGQAGVALRSHGLSGHKNGPEDRHETARPHYFYSISRRRRSNGGERTIHLCVVHSAPLHL